MEQGDTWASGLNRKRKDVGPAEPEEEHFPTFDLDLRREQ